jgi:hypothetical protein
MEPTIDGALVKVTQSSQALRQLKRQPLVPQAGAAEEPF